MFEECNTRVFCTKLKTEKARRSPHPVLVRHVKLFQLLIVFNRNLPLLYFCVISIAFANLVVFGEVSLFLSVPKKLSSQEDKNEKQKESVFSIQASDFLVLSF